MKANIKISALILSLVLLVSVLAGFGTQNAALAEGDGPVMAKIKADGKLVVGTEAQYAPYEFKNLKAEFVGCDIGSRLPRRYHRDARGKDGLRLCKKVS